MALLQSITVASVSEPSSNVTRTSDWKIADEQVIRSECRTVYNVITLTMKLLS